MGPHSLPPSLGNPGQLLPPFCKAVLHLQNEGPDFMVGKCVLLKMTHPFQSKQIHLSVSGLPLKLSFAGGNVLKSEVVGLNYSFQLNHSTRFNFSPVPRRFQI